ncbi:hypothetical protein MKZ38_002543 [Zalerion maritima]|uniref:S-adenosyl-L-methionine-dependent methyltransferase n=1 Tax=Zalerion maritima TaxID=339359 RepID=A0AAD5RVJ5_9PEZI|nr:hypothetical protein MKZ38_002543 [Zalerion maritima]
MNAADTLLDMGILPHFLIRLGIRSNLRERLGQIKPKSLEEATEKKWKWIEESRTKPIAIDTEKANEQHYEVETGVLKGTLGPWMKYSCCLYENENEGLAEAEENMLGLYVKRAGLREGMRVLDLGCGWGSGALYYATHLGPSSDIVAFSNSSTQKLHIEAQARERGLKNVTVITGNVAMYDFTTLEPFDRVVSIEMFEHMKNYSALMSKVSSCLKPGGRLFVHMFAHKDTPYDYEEGWMTRNFFQGGTMPSRDLLLWFQQELKVKGSWWVSGKHYSRTCEDWLAKMLGQKKEIWGDLVKTYGGEDGARIWWNRWQVFYLACSELFRYEGGDTWGVVHYLFEKPGGVAEERGS